MSIRAVILAAGRGSRLGIQGVPKCLAPVGGSTLLARQFAALRGAGVDRITVVAGYRADRVREACAPTTHVLENERFAETNSLYSLWLARTFLADGFVVLNGDVLVHPRLIGELLSSAHEDALLVSFRGRAADPLGDEEMKVRVVGSRVVDIAKTLDPAEADGENVGIARFSPAGARVLVEEMDRLVFAGCVRDWAPRAFQAFARRRPLHAVGTRGLPWIEIDFPDDYRRAVDEVLPLIDAPSLEEGGEGLALPPIEPEPATRWRPETGHV